MKKTFETIFKVLFYLMSVVNTVGVIAYIIYMASVNVITNANFFIVFGVFFAVNITANVLIGRSLIKSGSLKKRVKSSTSISDSFMTKI